jgi:hypothetical protein
LRFRGELGKEGEGAAGRFVRQEGKGGRPVTAAWRRDPAAARVQGSTGFFFLKPLLWGFPPQPPIFLINKVEKVFTGKLQDIYKERKKHPMEGFQSMITKFELYPSSPYA